jgi:electron transport complex protein RnfD
MEGKLIVTSSPHLRSGVTTRQIMLDVLISLVPCVVAATWIFGFRALLVTVFCAAVCVLLEFICRLVMKREQTIGDLSAAVSGVLLALTLPPSIGLAQALVGCAVAIVVVKQMFGGIGCNFVNPALTARIVMLLSFPTQMTTWTLADGTTTATPLGGAEAGLKELFFGTVGGSMGETCAAAILLGFVYLLARRVISPTIPVAFAASAAVFALILGRPVGFELLSGGLLFGAVFMATDYTTSPFTFRGKIIYGVCCGLLTVLIRAFGSMPEGVSYAVVLMNITVPLIERVTLPRTFGRSGGKEDVLK